MVIIGKSQIAGGGTAKRLEFEYTGDYVTRSDGVIELRSSGTFTSLKAQSVDVFLVGGGGAGRAGDTKGSAGGGGGFTLTESLFLGEETTYAVTIGAGGAAIGTSPSVEYAPSGGNTTFGNLVVNGGQGGRRQYRNGGTRSDGGNGGSGGGASAKGGTNGANGNLGQDPNAIAGTGQGTTTREFGELAGKLYAGGGTATWSGGTSSGVDGGGGASNCAGQANTGGGGGATGGTLPASFAGGSGIVCIRLHKE